MTGLGPNVHYDPASVHEWDELNQAPFLEAVLENLRAELGSAFGDYTFYIVSALEPGVRPHSIEAEGDRNVLIWISNNTATIPSELAPHFFAVFKSHLPGDMPDTNIVALNLGYVGAPAAGAPKPMAEREVSVFFSGHLTVARWPLYRALHPVWRRLPEAAFARGQGLRRRGFGEWLIPPDLSRAIPGSVLQFTGGFKQGLAQDEYMRLLGECKIALCPPGARTPETFRHVEAARAGAVVVSQPMPSTHLYRGAPYVIVDDWPTGIARCRELLADEATLAELQAATRRWWEDVLSERATARHMADYLRAK